MLILTLITLEHTVRIYDSSVSIDTTSISYTYDSFDSDLSSMQASSTTTYRPPLLVISVPVPSNNKCGLHRLVFTGSCHGKLHRGHPGFRPVPLIPVESFTANRVYFAYSLLGDTYCIWSSILRLGNGTHVK